MTFGLPRSVGLFSIAAGMVTATFRGKGDTLSFRATATKQDFTKGGIPANYSELEIVGLDENLDDVEEIKLQLEENGPELVFDHQTHVQVVNRTYPRVNMTGLHLSEDTTASGVYQDVGDDEEEESDVYEQDDSEYSASENGKKNNGDESENLSFEPSNLPSLEAWYGKERDGSGYSFFVRNRSFGQLEGTVQTSDKVYMITTRIDGSVFSRGKYTKDIPSITGSEFPYEIYPPAEELNVQYHLGDVPIVKPIKPVMIDVLVLYTEEAQWDNFDCDADTGRPTQFPADCDIPPELAQPHLGAFTSLELYGEVSEAFFQVNTALKESGVNAQLRRVGFQYHGYEPYGKELETQRDSIWKKFANDRSVQEMRDELNADVVVLVTRTTKTPGAMAMAGNPFYECDNDDEDAGCEEEAYMILDRGGMVEEMSFAHEMGHIFGLLDPVAASGYEDHETEPNVCGCEDTYPNCGKSIMCGNYDKIWGCKHCYDKGSSCQYESGRYGWCIRGEIPHDLTYMGAGGGEFTVDIMNKNAAAVASFRGGKEYAFLNRVAVLGISWGIAGVVIVSIFATANRRRTIRTSNDSGKEHFLQNQKDATEG